MALVIESPRVRCARIQAETGNENDLKQEQRWLLAVLRPASNRGMPRETRLDRLTQLLHPATYTHEQLIQSLRQANQDVAKAAELVLTGAVAKPKPDTRVVCIDDSDDDTPCSATRPGKKRKVMDPAGFMARLTENQEKLAPARKTGERPVQLRSMFTDPGETTITYSQLPTLTLHRSPIPASLASALFLEMMQEAATYQRHEWFLAGRKVLSPHTSGYYHDGQLEQEDSAASDGYWYAGKKVDPAPRYPSLLGEAAELITPFVNEVLSRRERLKGEYAGEWRASFAAVNHYQGAGSSVGWHADQSTCTSDVSPTSAHAFDARQISDHAQRSSPSPSARHANSVSVPCRTISPRRQTRSGTRSGRTPSPSATTRSPSCTPARRNCTSIPCRLRPAVPWISSSRRMMPPSDGSRQRIERGTRAGSISRSGSTDRISDRTRAWVRQEGSDRARPSVGAVSPGALPTNCCQTQLIVLFAS